MLSITYETKLIFFTINVMIIEQLSLLPVILLVYQVRIFSQYTFCFVQRISFNPRSTQIITGLGYHMTEGKENGNGLTMAHL
jgi:hypothetical protein